MKLNRNLECSTVNVEELLDVFQSIDSRIRELHQNSSQVFLQLNDFMKDYFKKNSIVSSNATKIFDTISGNNKSCLTNELNGIFEEFEAYKQGAENEFTMNLNLYTLLNNKADSLTLLIRNFKQDLLTLKFLTTNYKIISDEDCDLEPRNPVKIWEEVISSIYPRFTEIEIETERLTATIDDLSLNTWIFPQNTKSVNFSSYEELKSSISLINNKNLESRNHIPVLKEKVNNSSELIGKIITHLQYHDIIKQKIEHIQQSHFRIIESLKKGPDKTGKKHVIEDSDILSLIADISGLQAAQLILISKEYQNALEVISENFQKIAFDLASISTISYDFSYETNNSENTLINILKTRLDKSLLMLDEYNSSSFNHSLLAIRQTISEIHFFIIQEVITPLGNVMSSCIIPEEILSSEKANISGKPSIILQIDSLAKDIVAKKAELKKEVDSLLNISEKFPVGTDSDGFRSNLEKVQIRIMVSISKTLERLDNESKQLDTVLVENHNIKTDIINRLKETMDQADYYELFDKVLNLIIEQLNSVNMSLKSGRAGIVRSDRVRNLKEIENFYTVSSERIVHQKVIDEDHLINLSDSKIEDEDIELF